MSKISFLSLEMTFNRNCGKKIANMYLTRLNLTHPGGWDYILFHMVLRSCVIYHQLHVKLSTDALSLGDLHSTITDSVYAGSQKGEDAIVRVLLC